VHALSQVCRDRKRFDTPEAQGFRFAFLGDEIRAALGGGDPGKATVEAMVAWERRARSALASANRRRVKASYAECLAVAIEVALPTTRPM